MTTYHPIMLVLLATLISMTTAQTRCCAPDKLSADVMAAGKTQFTSSVDWSQKKAFENFGGKGGVAWKLYDGNTMEFYVRKVDGSCKKYPIPMSRYFQCVPDSAVHVNIDPEYDVVLDGWRYNENSDTTRLVVVTREGCLPYRIHKTTNDVTDIVAFVNIVQNVADPSVFQKDVSDCTDP